METTNFIFIALLFFIFGLLSKRIQNSFLTLPLLFTISGTLLGAGFADIINLPMTNKAVRLIAELTLVVVLFTDASRLPIHRLKKHHYIPIRLLLISLPLMIILGTLAAKFFFPSLSIAEAAIIGCILAPTDPALAQTIITFRFVPSLIRQTINIESGLNDGLVLPFLAIFISLASIMDKAMTFTSGMYFLFMQVIGGAFIGWIVAYIGGKLLVFAYKKKWTDTTFEKIASLAIALLSYSLASIISANGFIAAFISGITIAYTASSICRSIQAFASTEGKMLLLLLFLLFGAVFVGPLLPLITMPIFLYALVSLILLRPIATAIGLIRTKLRWESYLYIGWFGPRGIASIVFGLMVLENTHLEKNEEIFLIMTIAVFLSILLHGLTSYKGAKWYCDKIHKRKVHEHKKVEEFPLRYQHHKVTK